MHYIWAMYGPWTTFVEAVVLSILITYGIVLISKNT